MRRGALEVGVPSAVERPPLSEVKMTTVFSSSLSSWSLAMTRPTESSRLAMLAA